MFRFVFTDQSAFVYPMMLILAIISGYSLAVILLIKQKVKFEYIIYSIMLNSVLMFFGAVMFTLVTAPSILEELSFPFLIPLSSAGAGMGMLTGTLLISFLVPFAKKEFLYSYGLSVPLIYAISKIGCFFAGCCKGITYEGILAADYNLKSRASGVHFPVQLAETIVFMFIFAFCFILYIRKKTKYLMVILLLFSALAKFSLDYLRIAHVGKIITINQIACIIFILFAVVWLLSIIKKNKTCNESTYKEN